MADPFVAEIRIFPFNFAPRGWAFCNGQLLPISQNTALFSLLGITYGGNGTSNFALPNLQGRAPIGEGQGPGLSLFDLGQNGGAETVTLLATQCPSHTHALRAVSSAGNRPLPGGASLAADGSGRGKIYGAGAANVAMSGQTLSQTGGSQPHNNMQPYLTLNFCIAMQGVFPPRG